MRRAALEISFTDLHGLVGLSPDAEILAVQPDIMRNRILVLIGVKNLPENGEGEEMLIVPWRKTE